MRNLIWRLLGPPPSQHITVHGKAIAETVRAIEARAARR